MPDLRETEAGEMTPKETLELMAAAGYQRMFPDRWVDLPENSIERALWRSIAKNMIRVVPYSLDLQKLHQVVVVSDGTKP